MQVSSVCGDLDRLDSTDYCAKFCDYCLNFDRHNFKVSALQFILI